MPNKTYVIAEMACSHEGEVELAKKIIEWVKVNEN